MGIIRNAGIIQGRALYEEILVMIRVTNSSYICENICENSSLDFVPCALYIR